eukprot:Amastigsp_a850832_12.p1 type:complete len:190 gc:universal Amastigsp_a850832_12:280-849(+)
MRTDSENIGDFQKRFPELSVWLFEIYLSVGGKAFDRLLSRWRVARSHAVGQGRRCALAQAGLGSFHNVTAKAALWLVDQESGIMTWVDESRNVAHGHVKRGRPAGAMAQLGWRSTTALRGTRLNRTPAASADVVLRVRARRTSRRASRSRVSRSDNASVSARSECAEGISATPDGAAALPLVAKRSANI